MIGIFELTIKKLKVYKKKLKFSSQNINDFDRNWNFLI